jgi:formylglycine-generating enzyme required for sulfatase activity
MIRLRLLGPVALGIVALALTPVHAQKPSEELELDIGKGVKLKLCWIPGGKFTMGSPKSELERVHDETEHIVELSGFWMAKFHVTQKQYVSVSEKKNPSHFCAAGRGRERVQGIDTDDFPVEDVSWDDAHEWIKELNRRIGSGEVKVSSRWKGWKVSLPSSAQWEYAARGGLGNGRAFYWGNALNGTQANCLGHEPYGTETKGPYLRRTTKVGSYEKAAPHPWGLCDIVGNVYTWCEDYYGIHENIPKKINPVQTVRQGSDSRVVRGGAWNSVAWFSRCAFSAGVAQDIRENNTGFRIVLRPE